MEKYIKIIQSEFNNYLQYKYDYQFSILDQYNEELPLTSYQKEKSITTYSFPGNRYLVNLKNDKGDKSEKIDVPNIYNEGDKNYFISDVSSVNDIIESEDYSEISKIFILKLYFETNRNKLSGSSFNKLISFIDNFYKLLINEKGNYIEKTGKIEETLFYKYLINYAEPKILFSFYNSFIQNQQNNLSANNLKTIYVSINRTYTEVFKLKDSDNPLSESDLISLVRTIDLLLELSLNKPEEINIEMFNDLFTLFNKISFKGFSLITLIKNSLVIL